MRGHFFYSAKQEAVGRRYGDTGEWTARLDSGEIVRYSEMSDSETKPSLWDDQVYLGEGVVESIGEYRDFLHQSAMLVWGAK